VTACLPIITGYAQSVSRIHRHNGLDAMTLADSRINNQMAFTHRLDVFKFISQLFCFLLFSP